MDRKRALFFWAAYFGLVMPLALRAQKVTVDPGCEPYVNSDTSHQRVFLPAGTSMSILYTRGTEQEKSDLSIVEQLNNGDWSAIWSKTDIPKSKWSETNPATSIKADNRDRWFSATAKASNPNNGQQYGAMAYGQYCPQLDVSTDMVTQVLLILSPHPETELKNTVVYFTFTPPIPQKKFKATGK